MAVKLQETTTQRLNALFGQAPSTVPANDANVDLNTTPDSAFFTARAVALVRNTPNEQALSAIRAQEARMMSSKHLSPSMVEAVSQRLGHLNQARAFDPGDNQFTRGKVLGQTLDPKFVAEKHAHVQALQLAQLESQEVASLPQPK